MALRADVQTAADAGADIGERLLGAAEQGQDRVLLRIQVLLQHRRPDLLLQRARLLGHDAGGKTGDVHNAIPLGCHYPSLPEVNEGWRTEERLPRRDRLWTAIIVKAA